MKAMKFVSIFSSILLAGYGIFAVVWIWSDDLISLKTFIKTSITVAVVLVVAVIIALAYREYVEEKEMKKDKFLD